MGRVGGLSQRTRGGKAHRSSAVIFRSLSPRAGGWVRGLGVQPGFGLSPRGRGVLGPGHKDRVLANWTAASSVYPAHAGGTPQDRPRKTASWVYPRARKDNVFFAAPAGWCEGLSPCRRGNFKSDLRTGLKEGISPRTRGEPSVDLCHVRLEWSIPACGGTDGPRSRSGPDGVYPRGAGETSDRAPAHIRRAVYPSTRGNSLRCSRSALVSGLSPRTRGEHRALPRGESRRGSIPAHTGGVDIPLSGCVRAALSPRARGNTVIGRVTTAILGLSPRTRGWGGNYATSADVGRRSGISPRTQGKRQHDVAMEIPVRSIPAHAGEKSGHRPEPTRRESIPAHAGGTGREIESVRVAGVYPRANGGNATTEIRRVLRSGLSPRARGEPGASRGSAAPSGSMAAYARRDR